jgi:hypothetical protein
MTLKGFLKGLALLVLLGESVAWFWFNIQQDQAKARQVDQIFAECAAVAPFCIIRKTQNAKFANLTRLDYERHVCSDGRSAYRQTSSRVILSTYEPFFGNFTSRIRDLAKKHGCQAQ